MRRQLMSNVLVPGGSDDWCWLGQTLHKIKLQRKLISQLQILYGDSSAEVAEVFHDNRIPQNPHRDFELNRRDWNIWTT